MIYKTLFFIILICFTSFANGQEKTKSQQLKKLFQPSKKENYSTYLKNSKNELKATGALLFLGYKSFISSQDMGTCVFTPSCSVYAIQSLQNDNPIIAYFKIFDRLTRCHPLVAKHEYQFYQNTNLFHDPIH